MLIYALRAIGMYFLALLMIRLLGKRALGELGPFDFVVMTGVGHTVVSVALDKSIPYYEGIVILTTLAILEYFMGYLALKNQTLSHLITGKPVILIDQGKIVKSNMAKEKFNLDDLLQELRKRGIRNIAEVEKGILESCGGFTVIMNEQDEPVTRRDLGINPQRDQENFLTIGIQSRKEFFSRQDQNVVLKEVVQLPQALKNIEESLQMICGKIDYLESKIKSLEKK
ncbi:MAG: YetF domain-containing protein [Syntrophomonas sp.]